MCVQVRIYSVNVCSIHFTIPNVFVFSYCGTSELRSQKTEEYSVYQPTDALSKIQQNANYKTVHDKYKLLHVSTPACHPQGVS